LTHVGMIVPFLFEKISLFGQSLSLSAR